MATCWKGWQLLATGKQYTERRKMSRKRIVAVVVGGLLLAVYILSVGLAYERGHSNGYDEGWNDGTAFAESWGWKMKAM